MAKVLVWMSVCNEESPIRSWDDFAEALGVLPLWEQYALQQRVQDMVGTALQLSRVSVPYPMGAKL